jgi:hypothetical protein
MGVFGGNHCPQIHSDSSSVDLKPAIHCTWLNPQTM